MSDVCGDVLIEWYKRGWISRKQLGTQDLLDEIDGKITREQRWEAHDKAVKKAIESYRHAAT